MTQESTPSGEPSAAPFARRLIQFGKRPRILLLLLAAWSTLALLTQVFVNSGIFLDIHDVELDGALGGFALGFHALPLALLYLYCWRDPSRFHQIFWLAIAHQASIGAGVLYQWAIGSFSFESIVVPLAGSALLAVLSFLQLFDRRPS